MENHHAISEQINYFNAMCNSYVTAISRVHPTSEKHTTGPRGQETSRHGERCPARGCDEGPRGLVPRYPTPWGIAFQKADFRLIESTKMIQTYKI